METHGKYVAAGDARIHPRACHEPQHGTRLILAPVPPVPPEPQITGSASHGCLGDQSSAFRTAWWTYRADFGARMAAHGPYFTDFATNIVAERRAATKAAT